jgi:hypothetical protein
MILLTCFLRPPGPRPLQLRHGKGFREKTVGAGEGSCLLRQLVLARGESYHGKGGIPRRRTDLLHELIAIHFRHEPVGKHQIHMAHA